MKKTKQQKGITLIALIITIVVLLILAVVTINSIQGDGIIRYAQNARDEYQTKANEEQEKLNTLFGQIEGSLNGGSEEISHEGIIPEGATYTTGVTCDDNFNLNYDNAVTYEAGQPFPETISMGDIYTYNNYQYSYNVNYNLSASGWVEKSSQNGWHVKVLDTSKTLTYGSCLEYICGEPITNMACMFYGCGTRVSLSDDFTVPSTVEDMSWMFQNCSGLTSLPESFVIPDAVVSVDAMFRGCTNLTKTPLLPKGTCTTETFQGCDALEHIYYNGTEAEFISNVSYLDFVPTTCVIHFNDGTSKTADNYLD